ncbi:MAG TPA: endolytic transglycosylase MltG [Candidatus Paceibacterota bacterium]|nr:endolytic transglycosylase MltG [Candidatus Paceibacterota bacterium]
MATSKKRGKIHRLSRHGAYLIVGIGCLLAVLCGVLILSKPDIPSEATDGKQAANVIVDPGASPQQIVGNLANRGLIKNPLFFRAAVAIASLFHKVQAGGYYIAQGMSDWDIFRSLANPSLRYVTIAAGMRKQEVADLVGDKLDWDTVEKRELVNANMDLGGDDLEGKYFPGTYLFPDDATPEEVAKQMVGNYEEEMEKIKAKYPKSTINYDTALLIASIIQREAAGKQDMRLISGIIWNRIFDGMSLSMDATVQYARGKTDDGWWAPITASDIRTIDSPYNTYKNDGLPPTPISNPGPDAIDAAMNPQKTSCLFYIHDTHHVIHCSATYAGQLKNINTYLK